MRVDPVEPVGKRVKRAFLYLGLYLLIPVAAGVLVYITAPKPDFIRAWLIFANVYLCVRDVAGARVEAWV